jgi:hypothetical protein
MPERIFVDCRESQSRTQNVQLLQLVTYLVMHSYILLHIVQAYFIWLMTRICLYNESEGAFLAQHLV